jgi:signal transduction histidine kinase
VEPQLRARSLRFAAAADAADARAWADPEKTRQIALNLLSNAIKFTPAGGAVRVSWTAEDGRVLLRVRDTGIGIAPDKLERVFEPFVQFGRSLSSAHEGTGPGLAISRDLARAMGGDLTAESVPGEGSTFTLALPRAAG